MTPVINLNTACINSLDLSPARIVIERFLADPAVTTLDQDAQPDQAVTFAIHWEQEASDPRELSEIPEVRLWFLRLDAVYPWLPYILDWRTELSRYTAMLVPHEFKREGDGYRLEYNAEALDLFMMGKIFTIQHWLKQRGITSTAKLQQMAQSLGFEIDAEFWALF
ncbi:MAG: CRR6 family NdhI maturation factor [Pseudanabaena sp. ELA607]|jgi:hypothetical protein